MTDKETLTELNKAEFDQLIENFIDRDDDRIEPSAFLKALAELERKRAISIVWAGEIESGMEEIRQQVSASLERSAQEFYVANAGS